MKKESDFAAEKIGQWHRGAISGGTQAYYHEWLEYHGRHVPRGPVGIGASDEQIAAFYEEWRSGEFEAEMFCRAFERLLERCDDGYRIETDGKATWVSRTETGPYPVHDSQGEWLDCGKADTPHADVDR